MAQVTQLDYGLQNNGINGWRVQIDLLISIILKDLKRCPNTVIRHIGNDMTEREKSIVFITDLIESKVRKEREIEYYEEKLKDIEKKLFFLKKEQNVTETILDIIQNEKVLEFKQVMLELKGQTDEWKYSW